MYIDELCGRHGILYVARTLGMNISEEMAKQVVLNIKMSFSQRDRRRAYTPEELKELIMKIMGVSIHGTNGNRKDIGKGFSQK